MFTSRVEVGVSVGHSNFGERDVSCVVSNRGKTFLKTRSATSLTPHFKNGPYCTHPRDR
jgi:hypothetical protein